jgi:hypothetical protein
LDKVVFEKWAKQIFSGQNKHSFDQSNDAGLANSFFGDWCHSCALRMSRPQLLRSVSAMQGESGHQWILCKWWQLHCLQALIPEMIESHQRCESSMRWALRMVFVLHMSPLSKRTHRLNPFPLHLLVISSSATLVSIGWSPFLHTSPPGVHDVSLLTSCEPSHRLRC